METIYKVMASVLILMIGTTGLVFLFNDVRKQATHQGREEGLKEGIEQGRKSKYQDMCEQLAKERHGKFFLNQHTGKVEFMLYQVTDTDGGDASLWAKAIYPPEGSSK